MRRLSAGLCDQPRPGLGLRSQRMNYPSRKCGSTNTDSREHVLYFLSDKGRRIGTAEHQHSRAVLHLDASDSKLNFLTFFFYGLYSIPFWLVQGRKGFSMRQFPLEGRTQLLNSCLHASRGRGSRALAAGSLPRWGAQAAMLFASKAGRGEERALPVQGVVLSWAQTPGHCRDNLRMLTGKEAKHSQRGTRGKLSAQSRDPASHSPA